MTLPSISKKWEDDAKLKSETCVVVHFGWADPKARAASGDLFGWAELQLPHDTNHKLRVSGKIGDSVAHAFQDFLVLCDLQIVWQEKIRMKRTLRSFLRKVVFVISHAQLSNGLFRNSPRFFGQRSSSTHIVYLFLNRSPDEREFVTNVVDD
jgi:hypothetical protein